MLDHKMLSDIGAVLNKKRAAYLGGVDTTCVAMPRTWAGILDYPNLSRMGREKVLAASANSLSTASERLEVREINEEEKVERSGGAVHVTDANSICTYYNALILETPVFIDGRSFFSKTELVYDRDDYQVQPVERQAYDTPEL